MKTIKIYEDGNGQVVELPEGYRFTANEVMINRVGDVVMLVPKNAVWNSFMKAVDMFSEDFLDEGRPAQGIQERGIVI